MPNSLPYPDSFVPPNGVFVQGKCGVLIDTPPACNLPATRRARVMSAVYTQAANSYKSVTVFRSKMQD